MKKTLGTVAVLFLMATPAMAQQAGIGGFYLGGEIGTSQFDIDYQGTGSTISIEDNGFSYGALGGYRHDLGNWLLGVEGKIGESDVTITGTNVSVSAKREYSIAGFVGYELSPKWLLFGTIGYANLKYTQSSGGTSFNDKTDGTQVTFGVEYLISENFSLRGTLEGTTYDEEQTGSYDVEPRQGQLMIGGIFSF